MVRNFLSAITENWIETAKLELEGENPIEKLSFSKNGLTLKPYYTAEDRKSPIHPLATSTNPYLGARSWLNMPKVLVENASAANQQALHHLQNGADGILFDIVNAQTSAAELLANIQLNYCEVGFLVGIDCVSFVDDFIQQTEKEYDVNALAGAFFWKGTIDYTRAANLNWSLFHSCGIIITNNEKPVEEINQALSLAKDAQRMLMAQGCSVSQAAQKFRFQFLSRPIYS